MKKNIVIIAEKRVLKKETTYFSEEIDFSSENCTNGIIKAIQDANYTTSFYPSPADFCSNISKHKRDIVMATLWGGKHSRNKRGFNAAICEANNIKYVGADNYIQIFFQDKMLTKILLKDYIFSTPKAIQINNILDLNVLENINFYPCIIKPTNEGCSLGISTKSIAKNSSEAKKICMDLLEHFNPIMVEEYIGGVELSICCAGTNKKLDVLKCLSMTDDLQDNLYIWSFEEKKLNGGYYSLIQDYTEKIPQCFLQEAERLFFNLGKVDCMRIDGRLYNNKFYVIEISPDCSLSEYDLMAYAFKLAGYNYSQMFDILIKYQLN